MNNESTGNIGYFQIILVILSVYVLLALGVEVTVPLRPQTHDILTHIDNAICLLFLYDFFHRFIRSKNKLEFLRWGWIDLVSSIPALPAFRVGRAVRIFRVLRVLRGFRSVETIAHAFLAHRIKKTVTTALFVCILLVIFSSVAILQVENLPDSNIHGFEDALWWSIVTVTTVGYGDRFPTSTEGRLIGTVLMLSGVGLFSVLSGAFAAWFTHAPEPEREKEEEETHSSESQLAELIEEVKALRDELHQLVSS